MAEHRLLSLQNLPWWVYLMSSRFTSIGIILVSANLCRGKVPTITWLKTRSSVWVQRLYVGVQKTAKMFIQCRVLLSKFHWLENKLSRYQLKLFTGRPKCSINFGYACVVWLLNSQKTGHMISWFHSLLANCPRISTIYSTCLINCHWFCIIQKVVTTPVPAAIH